MTMYTNTNMYNMHRTRNGGLQWWWGQCGNCLETQPMGEKAGLPCWCCAATTHNPDSPFVGWASEWVIEWCCKNGATWLVSRACMDFGFYGENYVFAARICFTFRYCWTNKCKCNAKYEIGMHENMCRLFIFKTECVVQHALSSTNAKVQKSLITYLMLIIQKHEL